MKVLITGTTGFIGTALTRQLLEEGHETAVLLRNEVRLEESLRPRVKVYKADITNLASVENVFSSVGKLDVVFHLAACIDYNASKEELFRTNVDGAMHVFECAAKHGIEKFVFASSIEVIGPVAKRDIPADETHVCQPTNAYGQSKLEAERQITSLAIKGKTDTVLLRMGNVYGPGNSSIIASIMDIICNKNRRYLYLHRHLYRWHPVYIKDVVAGIIKSASTNRTNEIYILAGPEPTTIGTLSQLISREMGIDPKILELNLPERLYLNLRRGLSKLSHRLFTGHEERVHWAYSIEKAKRDFGYSPEVSLQEGVKQTLRWMDQHS